MTENGMVNGWSCKLLSRVWRPQNGPVRHMESPRETRRDQGTNIRTCPMMTPRLTSLHGAQKRGFSSGGGHGADKRGYISYPYPPNHPPAQLFQLWLEKVLDSLTLTGACLNYVHYPDLLIWYC